MRMYLKVLYELMSLQQNESVAAETVVVPEAVDSKGDAGEKSEQFVVTQEYIQDSMQKNFLTFFLESEKQFQLIFFLFFFSSSSYF